MKILLVINFRPIQSKSRCKSLVLNNQTKMVVSRFGEQITGKLKNSQENSRGERFKYFLS